MEYVDKACILMVFLFPKAAVTNYHKLQWLKAPFILSQYRRPEGWHQGVGAASSGGSGGGGDLFSLPPSGATDIPYGCIIPVSASEVTLPLLPASVSLVRILV